MTTPEPMRYKDTLPVDVDEAAAAVYVRVSDAPVARTSERIPNIVMIDYDDGGYPVGVEVHLAQPATIPTQPPVTGATQDSRVFEVAAELAYPGIVQDRHEDRARTLLMRADAADAAAGIRRVRLDEAIERAGKAAYEQYPGARWADATERQRRGPRDEVRLIVTAALGGGS